MILRAGSGGWSSARRPLLMGILNATPDSFSDGRGEEPVAARAGARAGAAGRGRGHPRRRRRVGARRPARRSPPSEEIARVVPLVARAVARRRARLGRHLQARGRRGGDRGGRGDRQRRLRAARRARWPSVCARTGAALVLMHTARGAEGHAARPGDLRRRRGRRRRVPARADGGRASRAGVAAEQLILDPGPDFAKTPAQTVAVLRRLRRAARARPPDPARRLAQGLRRRDHRPRARASAIAGTLAAVAAGVDAGAAILRVHDVAAAADFLAVRAVLRGERGARAARGPDAGALSRRGSTASLARLSAEIAGR